MLPAQLSIGSSRGSFSSWATRPSRAGRGSSWSRCSPVPDREKLSAGLARQGGSAEYLLLLDALATSVDRERLSRRLAGYTGPVHLDDRAVIRKAWAIRTDELLGDYH